MFHQVSYQPQAVAAVTHISSFLNTARQGSSVAVYPKHGRTSRVSSIPTTRATTTKSSKEQKEELEACITELARSLNVKELSPILGLSSHEDRIRQSWRTSYVSANTFFENKTGFSERSLSTDYVLSVEPVLSTLGPSVRSLYGSPEFHQLLSRCISQNHLGYEQRRHFKSDSTGDSIGIGLKKDGADKTQTAHADGSVRKSAWLGKQDKDLQKQIVAYAEGFAGNPENVLKSGRKTTIWGTINKYAARIILVTLSIYLMAELLRPSRAPGAGSLPGIFQNYNFEVQPEKVNVTFDDVKGVDEAKAELQEIVEYLKDPEKFRSLGAKLPKGVLLVGSPGIGKTLLARAVAGEAGVPFFHASGSEFDEMFVGSGSRKVKQLFASAKEKAPSVVFLDEIDSVGAKRTSSRIHPFANQTINQLLSEMDGFTVNEGVIVLGATNRKDQLDNALTRPGRFDVEVNVLPPDVKGREQIFKLYLKKVKSDKDVDLNKLANGSRGMTGADIENMVNQAALKAARDRAEFVTMEHLDFARDKILMGPQRKNKIMDEETNWCTSYHEAGHALVAYYTKDAIPLHKVTILPRGQSLGHTSMMDDKEIYNQKKSNILAMMDVSMGGRVAEELIYGPESVTTGASSDFQNATRMATSMVKQLGMSDKIGCRVYGATSIDELNLIQEDKISPAQQEMIDSEISRLLKESYARAKVLLKNHEVEHKRLAKALMKYETLSKEEITSVINNKPIVKNGKTNGNNSESITHFNSETREDLHVR